jgi:hypothetical protein
MSETIDFCSNLSRSDAGSADFDVICSLNCYMNYYMLRDSSEDSST